MARAHLSELSLEIPDGWEDQSTLTLLGPEAQAKSGCEAPRPSLVLRRQRPPDPRISLETFAAAQEALMARLMPAARLLARQALTLGAAAVDALAREYLVPGAHGGELRQLQIYFGAGPSFFVLAGTAPDGAGFDVHRARFLAIAATLQLR